MKNKKHEEEIKRNAFTMVKIIEMEMRKRRKERKWMEVKRRKHQR